MPAYQDVTFQNQPRQPESTFCLYIMALYAELIIYYSSINFRTCSI